MGLVTMKEMLVDARKGGYAVGAFEFWSYDSARCVAKTAKELGIPAILQVGHFERDYMDGYANARILADMAAREFDLPIALHLDHAGSYEEVVRALDGGFTSVMIDGSKYSFEENIALTKQVVDYAHARGVVVEGELGKLAGIEDDVNVADEDAQFTNPAEVQEFVERTGVDSLAIAIGTSHGAFKFKGEPRLRFDILEEVSKRLPNFPIVLHGASSVIPKYVEMINNNGGNMPGAQGVPEDMLRQAARMAVCKINIDSDLRLAMTGTVREYFNQHPEHFDPRQYLSPARANIKELVKHKIINVLGSNDKI